MNFSGTNLRVSLFNVPPWTFINKTGHPWLLPNSVLRMILTDLREKLNISFTEVWPNEDSHGAKSKVTGNFTGVLGILQKEEADIGLIPFGHSYSRLEALDFSFPFYYTYTTILSNTPKSIRNEYSFIKALNPEVWVAILISLLLVSLSLFLCQQKNVVKYEKNKQREPFVICVWNTFSSMLTQSIKSTANTPRDSCIQVLWYFTSLILCIAFSSKLASKYSTVHQNVITSLEDLLKFKDVKPIVPKNTLFQFSLQLSTLKVRQDVWSVTELKNGAIPVPKLFNAENTKIFREKQTAYIYELVPLKYFMADACQRGDSYNFAEPIFWMPLSLGLRKNLDVPLKNRINRLIRIIEETKQLEPILSRLFHKGRMCVWHIQPPSFEALNLYELRGIIALIGLGFLTASLSLASEFYNGIVR